MSLFLVVVVGDHVSICVIEVETEISDVFQAPMSCSSSTCLACATAIRVLLFLFLLVLVFDLMVFHYCISEHLLQIHVSLLIRVDRVVVQSRGNASDLGPYVVPSRAMLQVVGVAEVPQLFQLATSLLLVLRLHATGLVALERSCRSRCIDPHVVSLEKIAVPDEGFRDFGAMLVARALALD